MLWLMSLVSHLFSPPAWQPIATAPFDREIELADIGETVAPRDGSWLRHGSGWLDARTLRPVALTATHWRYASTLPVAACCC